MITAASAIRRWREEPPRFVREVFGVTPDGWQDEVLAELMGEHIALKKELGEL